MFWTGDIGTGDFYRMENEMLEEKMPIRSERYSKT